LLGTTRTTAVFGSILERVTGGASTPLGLRVASWKATGVPTAWRPLCTGIAVLTLSSLRGAVGETT
jgi:hypothetical protein